MPALIYQVVWQRVLSLYFGVDIYSTTVAVTVFMLGLGIGSMLGGRLADRLTSVVPIYALVEVGIALFGLSSLALFSFVGERFAGSSVSVLIMVDGLLLLGPTILMGMTLPLMTRVVVDSQANIGSRLAWLYGLNTLGAAVGAILSAYLLIGRLGMSGALYVAVSINCVLAIAMFALFRNQSKELSTVGVSQNVEKEIISKAGNEEELIVEPSLLSFSQVLVCAFLSGFLALGLEIVWYRLLRVLLHGTVYVFGTVLFVFLLGIALGAIASQRSVERPSWEVRFAWCQLGIAAYVLVLFTLLGHFSWLPGIRHLISASFFTYFHPSIELVAGQVNLLSLYSALDIFFWTAVVLQVPTFLMGYGFPNLMRAGSQSMASLGRSVGAIYFANILGSALGSLLVGFVLLHYFGTERTLQMLIVIGSAVALLIFGKQWATTGAHQNSPTFLRSSLVSAVLVAGLAVIVFPAPMQLLKSLHLADHPNVSFVGLEDRTGVVVLREQNAVVAFSEEKRIFGQRRLYIDGSVHGAVSEVVELDDEVHTALSAHPDPVRVLSVGLGDGHMIAAAAAYPDVKEIVVIELNESLRELIDRTPQGRAIESQAGKLQYVVDDGRRWLLANPQEKFDVVMMWPLHAAHAYSGSLYSQQFMNIIENHLTPGGLLYLRSADYMATAKTVASVFDHVVRFNRQVYVASKAPISFPIGQRHSENSLLELLTADRDVILEATTDVRVNTDTWPGSEYYVTYPHTVHMARGAPVPFQADPSQMKKYIRRE